MEVLAVEGRDPPTLLNQLSGCLIDVGVSVIDCYRPNSLYLMSTFLFSYCLLSRPLQDSSDVLWKGGAVG